MASAEVSSSKGKLKEFDIQEPETFPGPVDPGPSRNQEPKPVDDGDTRIESEVRPNPQEQSRLKA